MKKDNHGFSFSRDANGFGCINLMPYAVATLLLLVVFADSVGGRQADRQRWVEAERQIRRLSPAAHTGLPDPVIRYLLRHGYSIPQLFDRAEPHNVIQGRFNADAKPDWVVLASRGGRSAILVFWGGSAAQVSELSRRDDAGYLQIVVGDRIGYSRAISVVGQQYLADHYASYWGSKPPPIRHDAINDQFTGKASAVLYYNGRRWHTLRGAD